MLRHAPSWTAVLAALVLACAPGGAVPSEPPVPEHLEALDPRAVARIGFALKDLRERPERAQAWADLALVYSSEALKDLAIQCLAVAERLEPRQPKWPYFAGMVHSQVGDAREAIAAFQRSIALESGYAPAHYRLGNSRLDLGDLEGAEAAYRRATELDSTYPGGWIGRARVALQRDRTDEALVILERLRSEDPEDSTVRQLLNVAHVQAGDGSGVSAEEVVRDATPFWNDPWGLETRNYRREPTTAIATRLLHEAEPAKALALLEEERVRGASLKSVGPLLVDALQALGRGEEARALLSELLAEDPDHVEGLKRMAHVLNDAGDRPGAIAILQRLCALEPESSGPFATLGHELAEQGQLEPAVDAIRRALELGETSYDLRSLLGNSLVQLKRWSEARTVFAGLVAERPDHGDALCSLALTELRTGALDAAEATLARARASGNARAGLLRNVTEALQLTRERRASGAAGEDP